MTSMKRFLFIAAGWVLLAGPAAAQRFGQVEVVQVYSRVSMIVTDSDGGAEEAGLEVVLKTMSMGGGRLKEKEVIQNSHVVLNKLAEIEDRGYELVSVTSGGGGAMELLMIRKSYLFRKRD